MRLAAISGLLFLANCLTVADAALLLPLTCAFFVFSLIRWKLQSAKAAAAKTPRLRMVVNNTAKDAPEPFGADAVEPDALSPEVDHFPSTPEGRRKAEKAFLKVVKGRGSGGERLQ